MNGAFPEVRFVSELPEEPRRERDGGRVKKLVEALQVCPGVWAECRREPIARRNSLNGAAREWRKRYPVLETAVRRVGDEALLFARWVGES